MQRVVVLGGAGNFGARIVRALLDEPGVEVLAAGRRTDRVVPDGARTVALDIADAAFSSALRALSPRLVIHCAGPFQGQDYRVVRAAISAGADYIDLGDGRRFVAGFGAANDAIARAAGRTAICGASTLPALSSAVVDHLAAGLATLESVETVVAPGHLASRGVATSGSRLI